MSETAAPAAAVPSEGFVLARRGLPLAGSVPAQPGAAWLPAAVRSRVQAVAPRPESTLPAVEDEEAQEEETWWSDKGVGARSDTEEGRDADGAPVAAPMAAPDARAASREMAVANAIAQKTPVAHEGSAAIPVMADSPEPRVRRASALERAAPPALFVPARDGTSRAIAPPIPVAKEADAFQRPEAGEPARRSTQVADATHGAKHAQALPTLEVSSPTHHATPSPAEGRIPPVVVGRLQPTPMGASPDEPLTRGDPSPASTDAAQERTRATDVATTRTLLMGLAADGAAETPRLVAAPDLTVLLAPTPAPQRSVTIDRIAVTVQTPAARRAATHVASPAPSPQRAAAAPAAFRNPWASYHARRD